MLIALVLIFMTTVLGLSSMQRSTLENQMAINSVITRTVFQVAESATEQALNESINLSNAFDAGVDNQLDIDVNLTNVQSIEGAATLRYTGSGVAPGSSIGVFQGLRFEAIGTGSLDGQSRAGVTQGALREVPAS
jgi:hypothetical protein